jgi:hypothetical protein
MNKKITVAKQAGRGCQHVRHFDPAPNHHGRAEGTPPENPF